MYKRKKRERQDRGRDGHEKLKVMETRLKYTKEGGEKENERENRETREGTQMKCVTLCKLKPNTYTVQKKMRNLIRTLKKTERRINITFYFLDANSWGNINIQTSEKERKRALTLPPYSPTLTQTNTHIHTILYSLKKTQHTQSLPEHVSIFRDKVCKLTYFIAVL